MATNVLEFLIGVNARQISTTLNSARREMTEGIRAIAQAATNEGKRIKDALESIGQLRGLQTGLGATRINLEQARAEVARLGAAMEATTTPTRSMIRDFENAKNKARELETQFNRERDAITRLREELRQAGVDTSRLTAEQERLKAANDALIARTRRNLRTQSAKDVLGFVDASNTAREIERIRAAYERLKRTGTLTTAELARAHVVMTEKIIQAGKEAVKLSYNFGLVQEELAKIALLTAGLTLAAKESIAFETAMSDVKKVVDFPTPDVFAKFSEDLKNLNQEIPVTAVNLAKIAAAGGQNGIPREELLEFAKNIAKIAFAWGMTSDEAGQALGTIKKSFDITIPQTVLFADAVNYLSNSLGPAARNIVDIVNRTGSVAKSFGLTREQTAALATSMLALGIPVENAATALLTMLPTLQLASSGSADLKDALQTVGISAEKLSLDIVEKPLPAFMSFLQMMKNLSGTVRNEILLKMFGREHFAKIDKLIQGYGTLELSMSKVADQSKFAGSAGQEFATQVDTTGAKIDLMTGAINRLAINIGDAYKPAIKSAAESTASLLNPIADLVKEYPILTDATIAAVVAFGGFSAFRLVFVELRALILANAAAMVVLTASARAFAITPWGLAITAIAGTAVFALSKLVPEFFNVGESVESSTNKINQSVDKTERKLFSLRDALNNYAQGVTSSVNTSKTALVGMINVTDSQISKYNDNIGKHQEAVKQLVDAEAKSWQDIGELAADKSKEFLDQIDLGYAEQDLFLTESLANRLISENDYARRTLALNIQVNKDKQSESRRAMSEALKAVEFEYRVRIDNARRLNQNTDAITEEKLRKQKGILDKEVGQYKASRDQMIADEKRLFSEAKRLGDERKDFLLSVEDQIAAHNEQGKDPEMVASMKSNQMIRERYRMEKAAREGNWQDVALYGKRYMQKSLEVSNYARENVKNEIYQRNLMTIAANNFADAQASVAGASKKMQEEALKEAETRKKAREENDVHYKNLEASLGRINQEISMTHSVIVTTNTDKLQQEIKAVDDLIENRDRLMTVNVDLQQLTKDVEDIPNLIRGGRLDKVQGVIDFMPFSMDRFKQEFQNFDAEIKSKFNFTTAQNTIKGLEDTFARLYEQFKNNDLNLAVSDEEAIAKLNGIQQKLYDLDGKVTTHTVVINTVETHATGGQVGFARGGQLPGWGGGDKINALLEAGEFVVRKEAVRKYGAGLLHAINQMKMGEIPGFRTGGLINNLVIPSVPRFATGGAVGGMNASEVVRIDLSFNGGVTTPVFAGRDMAGQLVQQLKEMARGR